jgi:5'-nucleotidase
MRVLLTNDDGIDSPGLHALALALAETAEVVVVAPWDNQSAVARGITIREELEVEARDVPGAVEAHALTGTPVDCVRFADVGLTGGAFDVVVSGANLGVNLGDDVTYSGTVAAAMEGVLLGRPGLAVSQQPDSGEIHHIAGGTYAFGTAQRLVPVLAAELASGRLGHDLVLNLNCPAGPARGVRMARLGRRIWSDQVALVAQADGRRRLRLYGADSDYHREPGTDFAAIAEGYASLTALHVDPEHPEGPELLARLDAVIADV